MGMIVMVPVECHGAGCARPEQAGIFRSLGHLLWHTGAADMAVQADHPIGCGHHHVKIVRDQQDCTIYTSPGAMTEKMHIFLATYGLQDRRSDGGGLDEEGEDIEIVEMPLDELFKMARGGAINDAKTLILVQTLILEGV